MIVTTKCKKLEGCNQDHSPPNGDLIIQEIFTLASFSYREERRDHGLMVQRGANEHYRSWQGHCTAPSVCRIRASSVSPYIDSIGRVLSSHDCISRGSPKTPHSCYRAIVFESQGNRATCQPPHRQQSTHVSLRTFDTCAPQKITRMINKWYGIWFSSIMHDIKNGRWRAPRHATTVILYTAVAMATTCLFRTLYIINNGN